MKFDCMGNLSQVDTPQGFCVLDIYQEYNKQWYNTKTGEKGIIKEGNFIKT